MGKLNIIIFGITGERDIMRLIDADKIDFNEVFKGQSDFARDTREAAQSLIDRQPTAYEELAKLYLEASDCPVCAYKYHSGIAGAVNILKNLGY